MVEEDVPEVLGCSSGDEHPRPTARDIERTADFIIEHFGDAEQILSILEAMDRDDEQHCMS